MGPLPHPSPGHCGNGGKDLEAAWQGTWHLQSEWSTRASCHGSSPRALCVVNWQKHGPSVASLGAELGGIMQYVPCLIEGQDGAASVEVSAF